MNRAAVAVVGGAVSSQALPAATWLPAVRRLVPDLASPMDRGSVALTFDDGPHPRGTIAVLDRLDELGWPATFFLLGSAVVRHPEIAREVARRGHAVGVHGYDHHYLLGRSPGAAWRDLDRAKQAILAATGVDPLWWRPPYGVLSGSAVVAARRLHLRALLWSAWGKDWTAGATPHSIVATLTSGRLDGGVALLHDSDATSAPGSWRATVVALELLAHRITAAGLRVDPLPPLKRRSGLQTRPPGAGISYCEMSRSARAIAASRITSAAQGEKEPMEEICAPAPGQNHDMTQHFAVRSDA